MKRFCVSAGLIALGAAAAHGQYAPGLSPTEAAKPWSFSATIRGFYDDNYLTLPANIPGPNGVAIQGARDSYGVEASPTVSYNHSTTDTLLSATYTYDMRWYEDRLGTVDQSHQFNGTLQHEFSERYKITAQDSFAVAQEPGILDTTVLATPYRVPGSNIRNTGNLDFSAQLTRLFDVHVGYANTYYAYQENAGDEFPANNTASYSALLDRMDQTLAVDLRWKALPETTGVLGYQDQWLKYTSPEYIFYPTPFNPGTLADSRDQDSQFVYVGVDQAFSPKLNASVRVGVQYVDYYNYGNSEFSPYVDASLSYQYMPDSTLQIGVKQVHNSTDVSGLPGFTANSPVLDESSTSAYFNINHRVTQRFTVALMGQGQFSTFNGGFYDGLSEDFYIINLNLAYHFTPWITGETGYLYNLLDSQLPDRSYSRNEVYIGIRANY